MTHNEIAEHNSLVTYGESHHSRTVHSDRTKEEKEAFKKKHKGAARVTYIGDLPDPVRIPGASPWRARRPRICRGRQLGSLELPGHIRCASLAYAVRYNTACPSCYMPFARRLGRAFLRLEWQRQRGGKLPP